MANQTGLPEDDVQDIYDTTNSTDEGEDTQGLVNALQSGGALPPALAAQKAMAYSDSGTPMGPEGGFRASQVKPQSATVDPSKTSTTDTPQTNSVSAQQARLEQMIAELKAAKTQEAGQRQNIDMLRGGDQIAQAVASGYGGKIGDGHEQLDALTKTAAQPTEDLLKQFKLQQSLQGQRNPWQLRPITDDDGVTRQYRINTLTGEKEKVGQAGFALGGYMDKDTGRHMNVSKSDMNAPAIAQTGDAGSKATEQKNYELSDLKPFAPNYSRDDLAPLQKQFNESIKDNRDVATAITNLNAKVGVGTNYQDIVNSGLLGSIQTQAAKMAGQKGVLTDQDLVKFGGAGGLAAWANRFLSGAITGEMTADDIKFFRDFSKVMGRAAAADIDNKATMYADQVRQQVQGKLPGFTVENGKKWLSSEMAAPVVQGGGAQTEMPKAGSSYHGKTVKTVLSSNLGRTKIVYTDGTEEIN